MPDQNVFGGKNHHSLYVPMSEDEQEVLARLVEMQDFEVHIVGWGFVERPRVAFGDLRLQVSFNLTFDRPAVPMPVHYFDLELRRRNGQLLYAERQPTVVGGLPMSVAAGVTIGLVWDIAIQQMDPKLVKAIKPGAVGLTTAEGNRRLDGNTEKVYRALREREAALRQSDAQKVEKVTKRSKGQK